MAHDSTYALGQKLRMCRAAKSRQANDDPDFAGKTVGEVLDVIAGRMEEANGDIKSVWVPDEVFEKGFDHLSNGFDASLPANQVFSQWISVLPTDQIVAVEHEPTLTLGRSLIAGTSPAHWFLANERRDEARLTPSPGPCRILMRKRPTRRAVGRFNSGLVA